MEVMTVSYTHLLFELVMSLEEEFGVKIPTEDLEKINTVGDVIDYINNNK